MRHLQKTQTHPSTIQIKTYSEGPNCLLAMQHKSGLIPTRKLSDTLHCQQKKIPLNEQQVALQIRDHCKHALLAASKLVIHKPATYGVGVLHQNLRNYPGNDLIVLETLQRSSQKDVDSVEMTLSKQIYIEQLSELRSRRIWEDGQAGRRKRKSCSHTSPEGHNKW